MGRAKVEINVAEVERLAGLGLTQEEIALSLGINEKTLRRHKAQMSILSDAIKRGKAEAGGQVANKLYELCMAGNVSAIIWYEKTRRQLTDKVVVRSEDLDRIIDTEIRELARRGEESTSSAVEAESVN